MAPGWAKYQEGVSRIDEGKLQMAELESRESLRADPNQPTALLGLGEIALRRGDRALAADNFARALKAGPENPAVLTANGRFRAIIGDNAAAKDFLRKAIAN